MILFSIPAAVSIHTVTAFLYNGLAARSGNAVTVWMDTAAGYGEQDHRVEEVRGFRLFPVVML